MPYISYNGVLAPEGDVALPLFHRGLMFGDGFFESAVAINGHIPLWDWHWQRIEQTVSLLRGKLPVPLDLHTTYSAIQDLLSASKLSNARLRLQFVRSGGGRYLPVDPLFEVLIQAQHLESSLLECRAIREVGCLNTFRKPITPLSSIKSSSAQWYVLGAHLANENNWEEMILLNTLGHVAEALSSSVFIVKQGEILTPPLTDGGVDGVFRKFLLHQFSQDIKEQSLTVEDVALADEIWLTNAVRGIQPVQLFRSKVYGNKKAVELTASIKSLWL